MVVGELPWILWMDGEQNETGGHTTNRQTVSAQDDLHEIR